MFFLPHNKKDFLSHSHLFCTMYQKLPDPVVVAQNPNPSTTGNLKIILQDFCQKGSNQMILVILVNRKALPNISS